MNIVKSLGFMALSTLIVSAFTSCEEHNPFSEQEVFQQEYSKNFFKTYGNFPANQSWDFSNAPRTAPTDPSIFDLGREGITRAATRATGHVPEADEEVSLEEAKKAKVLYVPSGTPGEDNDPYYYLEPETFDFLKATLPEGVNNTAKGSPFVFNYETPSNGDKRFAIIPFYQGQGSVKYKLHMVAVDQKIDYIIWENWPDGTGDAEHPDTSVGTEDFQYNENWRDPKLSQSEWAKDKRWGNVTKATRLDNSFYKNIRSKPMIISGLTGEFYFYLEVTQSFTSYAYKGEHMSSKQGMMFALPCDAPEHINDYKGLFGVDESKTISQVMIIGCEDTRLSDWDINDISFMIVGLTQLPQKIEAKYSKRYLIEDLGTTVDFDFNDVVVDVTETVEINPDGSYGTVLAQEAVIRHKCGTVPFQVYFTEENSEDPIYSGAGSFDLMQGHVQGTEEQYTDFDDEGVRVRLVYTHKETTLDRTKYKVVGDVFWYPEKNNIRINVGSSETLTGQNWTSGNSVGQIKTGHFNKPGATTAPYIIAVPTTEMWTDESKNFPINDFRELLDPKGE